ncbi:MAG: helix-turn-helix transcriptional regulator [Acidobacteria bacterium]|nr:helix-turn-helix transcriptional regulator [Acidobacteriota bacterium]
MVRLMEGETSARPAGFGARREPSRKRRGDWAARQFEDQVTGLLARRLKGARVRAGVRQRDLARAIGVSQATISRMERGRRPPRFAEIARIAVQLRRPIDTFLSPPPPELKCGWERRPMFAPMPRELTERLKRGDVLLSDPLFD